MRETLYCPEVSIPRTEKTDEMNGLVHLFGLDDGRVGIAIARIRTEIVIGDSFRIFHLVFIRI